MLAPSIVLPDIEGAMDAPDMDGAIEAPDIEGVSSPGIAPDIEAPDIEDPDIDGASNPGIAPPGAVLPIPSGEDAEESSPESIRSPAEAPPMAPPGFELCAIERRRSTSRFSLSTSARARACCS